MTSQFAFTNDEWNDIATLPVLVGMAVAKAEDSGYFGSMREIRTLAASIAAETADSAAKPLIDAAGAYATKDRLDDFADTAADMLADIAVRASAEIAQILAAKTQPDEAFGYQRWVMGVARSVAQAAKENGVRISAPEAALLARLDEILS